MDAHEYSRAIKLLEVAVPALYVSKVMGSLELLCEALRPLLNCPMPWQFLTRTLIASLPNPIRGRKLKDALQHWYKVMYKALAEQHSAPAVVAAFEGGTWDFNSRTAIYQLDSIVTAAHVSGRCACGRETHAPYCRANACVYHCPRPNCRGHP